MEQYIKDERIIDDNGNILDAITYNIIPPERIIPIKISNSTTYIDIDTLYRSMVESNSGNVINPYTQQLMPKKVTQKVINYGETRAITYEFIGNIYPAPYSKKMPYYKTVGYLITDIILTFTEYSKNHKKGCMRWLRRDIIDSNNKSLYKRDLNDQITNETFKFSEFLGINMRNLALTKYQTYLFNEMKDQNDNIYILYDSITKLVNPPYIICNDNRNNSYDLVVDDIPMFPKVARKLDFSILDDEC